MSQQVPALNLSNVPAELMNSFSLLANDMFANIKELQFRFIKARNNGLELNYSKENKVTVPYDAAQFICLGASPYQHCVYYKDPYSGKEVAPTLLWINRGDGKYPDALPESARHKDAQGRWPYQIKLRTAWAYLKPQTNAAPFIDFENFFIFDLPSTSLYGKEANNFNAFSWSGVSTFCRNLGFANRQVVHPAMFIMQFVQGKMQGQVYFRFAPNNQQPMMLSADVLVSVLSWLQREEVKEALEVREILTPNAEDNMEVVPPIDVQATATPQVLAPLPGPGTNQPVMQQPVMQQPVMQQPVMQQPQVNQQPQQPVMQQPVMQQPVMNPTTSPVADVVAAINQSQAQPDNNALIAQLQSIG